jgi:hypothetical protein
MFVLFSFTHSVWDRMSNFLKQNFYWMCTSLSDCFDSWTKDKTIPNTLAIHLCWFVWLERNQVTFKDKSPSIWVVICKTLRDQSRYSFPQSMSSFRWSPICQFLDHTIAFFDGASN